jgi:hypothetical protein
MIPNGGNAAQQAFCDENVAQYPFYDPSVQANSVHAVVLGSGPHTFVPFGRAVFRRSGRGACFLFRLLAG